MSFEDLQKKWKNQFPDSSGLSDSKSEIDLLGQIRRNGRQFRNVVLLLAARDVVILSLAVWLFRLIVNERVRKLTPEIIRQNGQIWWIGLGLIIVLTVAAMRVRPNLLPPAPSGGEAGVALSGRIRRDGRRFDAMILWRDIREIFAGIFLVFITVVHARHVVHYPVLVWIAAVLFSFSSISFLTYRLRTQAQRPPSDGTLLGTLTLSIYQTRRQVQLLNSLWWYFIPIILGGLLMGPIQGALAKGGLPPKGAVVGFVAFIAIGSAVWRLNRWAARSRLRPRLEQLEKLKAELSIDESSNQP